MISVMILLANFVIHYMGMPYAITVINDSGGENDQPMGSGTKEDESINGSDELRTTVPVDALDLSALETTLEAEQEEDASKLWNSIVEEASNI
ncbi:hypothetical protein LINPERPRIM_LOCUS12956 [Linum perenne]